MPKASSSRLRLRTIFRPVVNPLAAAFAHIGFTPNMITALGAVLATLTPFLMSHDEYVLFGLTVFFVGLLDGVDGAVARITKKTTEWGGFLDSLLDRYGDSIILISYLFNPLIALLGETEVIFIQVRIWVCLAVVGSLMVSYIRAKSEATGVAASDIGIGARSERLLILSITGILGSISGYIAVFGLLLTAVLANETALHRLFHSYAVLKDRQEDSKRSSRRVNRAR